LVSYLAMPEVYRCVAAIGFVFIRPAPSKESESIYFADRAQKSGAEMPYSRVPFKDLGDPGICRVFAHANNYLADVFTMLGANPPPESNGGKCNFSIALVLACVLDGLATEIHPIVPPGDVQKRMTGLLARLDWGSEADGWISRDDASEILYVDIRGPLVHNLAADTKPWIRRPGYGDPAIVHPLSDGTMMTPDEVDATKVWDRKLPMMWDKPPDARGNPGRIVVSTLALYWHVKSLTLDLATDPAVIESAIKNRHRRKIRS